MRQFNQRSVQAFIDQKFHRAPERARVCRLRESVFATPTGEKLDARGAEKLGHKEERGRFSLYQEMGNPLGSLLASPLASNMSAISSTGMRQLIMFVARSSLFSSWSSSSRIDFT